MDKNRVTKFEMDFFFAVNVYSVLAVKELGSISAKSVRDTRKGRGCFIF